MKTQTSSPSLNANLSVFDFPTCAACLASVFGRGNCLYTALLILTTKCFKAPFWGRIRWENGLVLQLENKGFWLATIVWVKPRPALPTNLYSPLYHGMHCCRASSCNCIGSQAQGDQLLLVWHGPGDRRPVAGAPLQRQAPISYTGPLCMPLLPLRLQWPARTQPASDAAPQGQAVQVHTIQ